MVVEDKTFFSETINNWAESNSGRNQRDSVGKRMNYLRGRRGQVSGYQSCMYEEELEEGPVQGP